MVIYNRSLSTENERRTNNVYLKNNNINGKYEQKLHTAYRCSVHHFSGAHFPFLFRCCIHVAHTRENTVNQICELYLNSRQTDR